MRCKNWFPTLWWVSGTNVLVASFFHQRLFLFFFLSPVKCYKYHPLRRYQLFWRQEQTTVEKKTSLRADQLTNNQNLYKLILPSWNSNEPCFFFHGKNMEKHRKNNYLYIYIHSKTNLRIDTANSLRIHTWLWGPCILSPDHVRWWLLHRVTRHFLPGKARIRAQLQITTPKCRKTKAQWNGYEMGLF